jgi:acetate kinase
MPVEILTLNGGSSTIKFALFQDNAGLKRLVSGQVEQIGSPNPQLEITDHLTGIRDRRAIGVSDHLGFVHTLAQLLEQRVKLKEISGVGHRIVHGGARYSDPEKITEDLLSYLNQITPYDPEHLRTEIGLIRAMAQAYPQLLQVACFDTAFHQNMPRIAKILPIPRRYFDQGIRRYGFHGLSYAFLMDELKRVAGEAAARGRIILAHLGNGASMAAVQDGASIDTSMSFTPTAGLVMGSRTGDLDPGLMAYLTRTQKLTPEEFYEMANFESGLLGVSGISSNMQELLAREADDPLATEAIALFCYQAKKFIGAYAAALGGLDILVFSGGIGENAGSVRWRTCAGLKYLGIELDQKRNDANAPVISSKRSGVTVRVIKTDEEIQIAQSVRSQVQ